MAPAAPHICPVCDCGPSETQCAPPIEWHASSEEAPGLAGILTPFDAPSSWDGSCTSVNGIPPGLLCEGVPCVRSVAVSAPQITEAPCTPSSAGIESAPPHAWGMAAGLCSVEVVEGACEGADAVAGKLCVPDAPEAEVCIVRDGEHDCPGDAGGADYSVKHTFFEGVADTRSCAPCDCGPASGGKCTALALAYSDGACSSAVGAKTVEAGAAGAGFDVPAGTGLGGKTAEVVATSGTCEATGGEALGSVGPAGQVTVCCLEGWVTRSR